MDNNLTTNIPFSLSDISNVVKNIYFTLLKPDIICFASWHFEYTAQYIQQRAAMSDTFTYILNLTTFLEYTAQYIQQRAAMSDTYTYILNLTTFPQWLQVRPCPHRETFSNCCSIFNRPDALPVAKPTMSAAKEGQYIISMHKKISRLKLRPISLSSCYERVLQCICSSDPAERI